MNRSRLAARQCAGVLAKALKGAWRPYAKDLIEPMAMTGLTDTLVRALKVGGVLMTQVRDEALDRLCGVPWSLLFGHLVAPVWTQESQCAADMGWWQRQ